MKIKFLKLFCFLLIGFCLFFGQSQKAKASLNFDPLFEAWTGDNNNLYSTYQSGALNGNASLTVMRKFETIANTKGIAWGYSSNVSPNALSMPLTSAGYALSFWYRYNGDGGTSGYWYNSESFYVGFSTTGQESGRNFLLHFDAVGTIDVQVKPDGTGATCQNGINYSQTVDMRDGNWHFIVINSANDRMQVYKDGVLARSCGYYGAIDYTSNPINWFQLRSDTAYNTQSDDIAIYKRPLTQDEISGIYNSNSSVINYNSTPATYCGDTICQTANENCATCPVDCGECASNPVSDISNLFFFYNPYTLYNQTTGKIRYIYDQNFITSHDYIEIRKISDDWATSTFMATSTIIDETGFFNDKNDGNSFFPLSAEASSTSGYIHYEVIGHLAAYWSPTLGDVAATTTIPYVVTVNWQTLEQPTVADIIAASSSNPFYDKNSIEQAVCTPEQWATPDPQMWLTGTPMPALNFTVMSCVLKFSLLDMGNKFVTVVTNGFYKAGNILKNVFPFNVFTNLNDAWKNSATSVVLPELSFLTPTNGNLTAQIPTTGTSTATIVLWGKDIFTSSSTLGTATATKTNQLFLAIKTIIKWALWGLFGLWAIKNGRDFVKNLTSSE